MRTKKNFLIFFILVYETCIVCTNCFANNYESDTYKTTIPSTRDSKLIGIWEPETVFSRFSALEFEADGTYFEEEAIAKWGTSNNKLYILNIIGILYVVPYSVNNSTLTLEYGKVEFPDHPGFNDYTRLAIGVDKLTYKKKF